MSITPPDYPGELRTGEPNPPVRLPNSIVTASLFMWLGALVYLAAYVVGVVRVAGDKDEMRVWFTDDSRISDAELDLVFAGTLVGIVFVGIVSVLLWAWMAWMNGLGRRWARIVASVLGAINISFLAWGLAYYQTMTSAVVSWFTVIVGALTIALLWNKDSSAYYQAARVRNSLPPGAR